MIEKTLIKKHDNIRNFSYSKGVVQLNFSLRVDVKHELQDFKACLEAALEEIDESIKLLDL